MWPKYTAVVLAIAHFASSQIQRTGWTITADSFQPGNEPTNAIDSSTTSIFHTQWTPVNAPLPHNLTIDMKTVSNINAISYLPRQDGNSNGNIGQHQIQLSTDGTKWGPPVVTGTYLDDSSLKKSSFVTQPARYVRIVALTEAGNRGPWMSAADINVFAAASYTPPPISLGNWGPTIDLPITPAAAAIEHDSGKLLGWSSFVCAFRRNFIFHSSVARLSHLRIIS